MKKMLILLVVLVVILAVGITWKSTDDTETIEENTADDVYFGEVKTTGLVGISIASKETGVSG